jgi:enoyl-CoA hydratase/isomerase-like protein
VGAESLLDALRRGSAAERFAGDAGGLIIVRIGEGDPGPDERAVAAMVSQPFVVVVVPTSATYDRSWLSLGDVVLNEAAEALSEIVANVEAHPRAAVSLALLLRGQPRRSLEDGLVAESTVYSMLQGGPEFAAWRSARPVRAHAGDDGDRVQVDRAGSTLRITLTRASVRNALDARMRDELLDALRVAMVDDEITRIEVRGQGPAFCSGGDLDEFGSRADPATAHIVRLSRNVARAMADLRDRTTVYLHGACMGAGIELAAFAGDVVASSDTSIALPEVSLGLIPGAGGTVSLPLRIGRLRTAWLALSGRAIDAGTAHDWGLVDRVAD